MSAGLKLRTPCLAFTLVLTLLGLCTFVGAEVSYTSRLATPTYPHDGANPNGLISDAQGNLYGTTSEGGSVGWGTVFELAPNSTGGWTETILYSFGATPDAESPAAGLLMDSSGHLFGTSFSGGAYGYGAVFELTRAVSGTWNEKVLYSFPYNGNQGFRPQAALIADVSGNLYGTSSSGGTLEAGAVFELQSAQDGTWSEKTLYSFSGPDGNTPLAPLIFDAVGNLYGTTYHGGAYSAGTIFRLEPTANGTWTYTDLHDFGGEGDGTLPLGRLISDAAGNLYGTTYEGGSIGFGTVYELKRDSNGSWTEKVLYSFRSVGDGQWAQGGLTFDSAGNLFGTTGYGGSSGYGNVFELSLQGNQTWREYVVENFNNRDGFEPRAPMLFDSSGNLYGTTYTGGILSRGLVFKLARKPGGGWAETILHNFGSSHN